MLKPAQRSQFFNSVTSLLMLLAFLVLAFLVLGFCPLRNAICSFGGTVSQSPLGKVPSYAKIVAHDDCIIATLGKTISFQKGASNGNAPIFFALLLTAFFACGILIKSGFRYPQKVVIHLNTIPIYLKNRALLI